MEWIIVNAPTVDEAKQLAIEHLGVLPKEVETEVLQEPGRVGLLLRRDVPARVRARITPRGTIKGQERFSSKRRSRGRKQRNNKRGPKQQSSRSRRRPNGKQSGGNRQSGNTKKSGSDKQSANGQQTESNTRTRRLT